MARFHYRMQSILDIKEKLESRAKQQFQAAQAKLDEENEKMRVLHEKKKEYILNGHELLTSKIDVRAIKENKNAIKHQQVAVVVASKGLEKARTALQEVMQERKTHEKLKEKAFDEYLLEEGRRESKEIDELVSYRHGQKVFQDDEFAQDDNRNKK